MHKLLQKPSPGRWHTLARQLKKISSATALGSALLFGGSFFTSQANAQSIVNNYTFNASSGTYTPLGATATPLSGMLVDSHLSGALPLGFTFNFDGVNYTEVKASSNGFLSFNLTGTDSQTGNNLATVSVTSRPIVAPLWDDLDGRATGGSKASYETTGTAGSRVFTFEWDKWEFNFNSGNPVISFQVKLYEGSNKIEFIYKQESGAVTSGSASIGIAGTGTGAGNFISLNNTTASPTASYATETTSINTKPANGQIYTFNQVATPLNDVSVTALTGLATDGCFGPNQTITFTIKNNGTSALDMSVTPVTVSAAVTGTNPTTFTPVVINTGTLAPGATQNVTVSTSYNMSTTGTYTFNASATTQGEVNTANDILLVPATRTVTATASATPVTLPQTVDFTGFTGANLTTVFPNWKESTGATVPSGTSSAWANRSNLGSTNNVTAWVNLSGASKREWIVGPKFTATASSVVLFKAAVTTASAITAHASGMAGTDDKVQVMVSTDCGATFTPIYTIDQASGLTNVLTNQYVSLAAYAGQNIVVAFFATEGTIDDSPSYDFHIDDVFIGTPAATVDLGASAFISPAVNTCYGVNETAIVTIKNFGSAPIDFSATNATVSVRTHGAGSSVISIPVTSGILAPGATQNVTVGPLNMAAAGTYNFRAYTTIAGDTDASSDTARTSRTTLPIATLPQPVTFTGFTGSNLTTVFPNWREASGRILPTGTSSSWTSSAAAQTTYFGSTTAKLNFPTSTSTSREEWIVGPSVIATATTAMAFKAAVTSSAGTAAATMLPTDSVKVMVSTNCGASFTKVGAISGSNNLTTTLTDFVFSLGSYAGQNIVVALLATNGSARPSSAYDFILDDIFLGTPPPLDMGVSALVTPVSGMGCYSATEPVTVTIKNYHAQPINFATDTTIVRVNITGPITQTFNVTLSSGTLASGATQNVTLGTINMSVPGTYTFNSFTILNGDGNATNNALPATTVINGTITSFPFKEDFETFPLVANSSVTANGWTTVPNNTTSAFRWNVDEGTTPSSDTGPSADHTTGTATGNFVFTEASSGAAGDSTTLVSPCINLAGQTSIGMEFWYHMYGATTGTLNVDVFNGTAWVKGVFTLTGQQQTSRTEAWRRARIDLSAYSGSVIKVRFRALRGTDYTGDIAVDDVLFYVRSTVDVGAVALAGPGTISCFSAAEPISITIKNDGLAPVDFSVNPAIVTVNVTGATTQTIIDTVNTGTLAIGATQNVTVGTLNMTAYGTYTFNATATALGDLNTAFAAMPADSRTLAAPVSLPQTVSFTGFTGSDLTTLFPNWYETSGANGTPATTSDWANSTGLGGSTNVTARINLWATSQNDWIVGPKVTPTANTVFRFKTAITDWNNLNPDAAGMQGTDDKVQVMVSTDCGVTFTPIFTLDASNTANLTNVLTEQNVSLGTYAGQNIILAIKATDGPIDNDPQDYDFHIDDLFISDVPAVDIGATALAGPTVINGCYGPTQNVIVTIRNTGSAPIDFSTTNATVTVNVTGTGAAAQTFTVTLNSNSLNNGSPLPILGTLNVPVGVLNMSGLGTYIFNGTATATGDGNTANDALTASTITVAAPVAGTASNTVATTICQSGTPTLTLTGFSGGNIQWQQATAATGPFTNISGATTASFTASSAITSTTYYQAIVACGVYADTSNVLTVIVNNPLVTATTGDTRCGAGTVNLTATPNAGSNINWFSAATGGNSLATGNTFSPNVSATTTYYAEASVGGTYNAGLTSTGSYGTYGSPGSTGYGLTMTFTQPGVLEQAYVYPVSAGNVIVQLYTRAGVAVGSPITVAVSASDVGNKTLIPLNITVPTPGDYNLVNISGSVYLNRYNPYSGPAYPLNSTGNVFSITGGATSASSAPGATTYYSFFDLRFSNACRSARTPVVATVNPVPVVNLGADQNVCGATSTVLDAGNAGANYQWFLNNAPITGATSQTLTATANGTYKVNVTNATSCTGIDSVAVVFNTKPAMPTVTASGVTTFCQGNSVVLTGASTTTGVTYSWLLNNAIITGATAATYTANASGAYQIIATNAAGCTDTSVATTVTVNAVPVMPTITAGGATTFCAGDSVMLTGATTTTGVTYQWLLNGTAVTGATAANFNAKAAGNYAIVVANASGCSDTSVVTAVSVTPLPATPTITQGGGSGQELTSSSATGNQWYLNGTAIAGATGQTYTTTANGNYTVVVTDTACSSLPSAVVNITNTGIKGALAGMSVSIYPNPSNGKFNVKLIGYKQDAALELYSLTGQLIAKENVNAGQEVTKVQVKNLAAGTYLLKVVSAKGVQISKLIVE